MPKAKPIAPFYDESSTPTSFPSMLTDQLELFGSTQHSPLLLANEILPSKSKNVTYPISTVEQSQGPDLKHARVTHSPYPASKKAQQQSRASSRVSDCATSEPLSEPSDSSTSASDSDSDCKSVASMLSESAKIAKPPGEPGRPGSGGYNLESAVGWNHKTFVKFKSFTHKLIDEHLNTTKCASAQNPTSLNAIRKKAIDSFPDLENYKNCWPVTDMIMMHLKYTSSRARCHELEVSAGKARRGKSSVAQK